MAPKKSVPAAARGQTRFAPPNPALGGSEQTHETLSTSCTLQDCTTWVAPNMISLLYHRHFELAYDTFVVVRKTPQWTPHCCMSAAHHPLPEPAKEAVFVDCVVAIGTTDGGKNACAPPLAANKPTRGANIDSTAVLWELIMIFSKKTRRLL